MSRSCGACASVCWCCDIQPGRLARAPVGEPPSPLAPPSGCVYRTRCPHAIDICRERLPPWDEVDGSRRVACHRWRELSDGAPQA
ncbi:MAG: hypothetical protein E6K49_01880 [Gammaproteobacteria bacterium]|nr:MAG: hypothetical protein E6K49_01880 [Gammaproteobacteria bacterium]